MGKQIIIIHIDEVIRCRLPIPNFQQNANKLKLFRVDDADFAVLAVAVNRHDDSDGTAVAVATQFQFIYFLFVAQAT